MLLGGQVAASLPFYPRLTNICLYLIIILIMMQSYYIQSIYNDIHLQTGATRATRQWGESDERE